MCHVYQEKNKLSEISQTYSPFFRATPYCKGKRELEEKCQNGKNQFNFIWGKPRLQCPEVTRLYSSIFSQQWVWHQRGRQGMEQHSGARAEIEKMKERLLWLQTVSNRCREQEGGQEQSWTEENRKQMWRKLGQWVVTWLVQFWRWQQQWGSKNQCPFIVFNQKNLFCNIWLLKMWLLSSINLARVTMITYTLSLVSVPPCKDSKGSV